MADYSKTTWVADDGTSTVGTPLTDTRLNNIETGVKDASEHHERVTALPTATAALKHHVVFLDATDGVQGQGYYCDGSAWTKIGQPEDGSVVDITDPDVSKASLAWNGTSSVNFGNAGNTKLAFKFQAATNFTLTRGVFWLSRNVDISFNQDLNQNIVIKVLNDNSGVPGATVIGSTSIPAWKITQTGQLENVAFGSIALTGGTNYWIEFSLNFTPSGLGAINVGRGVSGGLGSVAWNGSAWGSNIGISLSHDLRQGTEDWALKGTNNSPPVGGAVSATTVTGYGVKATTNNGIAVSGEAERGQAFAGVAHYGSVFRARRQASNSETDLFRSEDEVGGFLSAVNKRGNHVQDPVTSFPSSPVKGERVVYQHTWTDSGGTARKIDWTFMWNATDSRWQFIGGPPLFDIVDSEETNPNAIATFGDLATVGPTITVPRPGSWWLESKCVGADTSHSANLIQMGVKIAAAAASGMLGAISQAPADNYVALPGSGAIVIATAADVVKMQYRGLNSASSKFANRRLTLTPIWVT